jgi:hypothetical protein
MAVSKRLRFEILRRDNHTCRYCGASAPDVQLRIDHVLPEALGGLSVPENLVTSCEPCNSGKSSVAPDQPIVADVRQSDLLWAQAMAEARAIRADMTEMREGYAIHFETMWSKWKIGSGQFGKPIPLPGDWRATLYRFYEADVAIEDIQYAVTSAMGASGVRPENTFRYFCGVVWNILRETQEAAKDIAAANLAKAKELDS